MTRFVPFQVKSILSWGDNKRNHFRLKCRVILERLVRKFGLDMVAAFIPKKHQRLVLHIRKTAERQRRRRRQQGEGGGSEEAEDSEGRAGAGRKHPTPRSVAEGLASFAPQDSMVGLNSIPPAEHGSNHPDSNLD